MKKPLFAVFLFFFCCLCIFAQDDAPEPEYKKRAFTYGAQMNMNFSQSFAGGAVLGIDFFLPKRFSTGVNFAANAYLNGQSNVLEPSVMLRYYFIPLADQHSGFFVQLDLGASLTANHDAISLQLLGGVRSGYRFTFGNIFFIEPYIRAGYPFLAGAGFTFGYRY